MQKFKLLQIGDNVMASCTCKWIPAHNCLQVKKWVAREGRLRVWVAVDTSCDICVVVASHPQG